MPVIHFPAVLAKRIGQYTLTVEKKTLAECLEHICQCYPSIESYIFENHSHLTPFIKIFINQVASEKLAGLKTLLQENDHVQIVVAIAGG